MKTNASSTASALGIERCIYPCEVGTKITYGGSNLQLSRYKLHKRGQQLFCDFMATKFTFVLLSKIISKIRYSKSCILYHITYTTIEALLYQPLRFILTFKSHRSMIPFERKHCIYDMHIYFHASFQVFHWWHRLLHKAFVRTNDSLYVSINHSLNIFVLLYNFLFMCNAFVFCLKKLDIFLEKAVLISILHHLCILMFIYI